MRRILPLSCIVVLASCRSLVWHGHSPDRAVRIEVVQKGSRQWVSLDGRPGARYRAIGLRFMAFSPDSRRLAYPARTKDGWCVVLDGRDGRVWDGIGELVFSPDGRRLAYAAQRGRAWRVVSEGRSDDAVSAVLRDTLRFTPDGRKLVYVARIGLHVHLVVDGRAGPPFDGIARLALGPPARIAYVGRRARVVRVLDGANHGQEWERITELKLSQDGTRLAYLAMRHGRWHAVIDGQVGPGFSAVAGLTFGPNSRSVAYAAQIGPASQVVHDDRLGPIMDGVRFETLAFTTDGRLSYVARQAGRYHFVLAGLAGPAFDELQRPVIRGNRWGYLARRGRQRFFVSDGQLLLLPDEVTWFGDLELSREGRRFAFLARGRNRMFVRHDRGTSVFDFALPGSLVFDPNGRGWACLAGERAARTLFVAVEGLGRRAFDANELVAEVMRTRGRPASTLIRQWVSAELALFLRQRGASRSQR